MELGQKIRSARLEAGLSQRQLCGDTITRNMLSQIENGTARPSMDTLQILAARLHKTVGYFLDEEVSCNEKRMQQLRQAAPEQVGQLLKDYVTPDPIFDRERYFLESNAYLALARQALQDGKKTYAQALLEKGVAAGEKTPYFQKLPALLLAYEIDPSRAEQLCRELPNHGLLFQMQAESALQAGQWDVALAYLKPIPTLTNRGHFLRGEVWFGLGEYEKAAQSYLESQMPVYDRLEKCYRELGDFEKAYYYACLRR
jgi:transcriptional regulator with XRE-family HTH domain